MSAEPPQEPPRGADDLRYSPLPGRVVAAAYVLALVTLLIPLAFFGAVFAGYVLARRGHRGAGAGVAALAVACFVLGMTVVWSQL